MKTKISGRCSCGSITYESSGAAKFSMMCQCRQCQRISGAGHSAQFAVEAAGTTINGNVKIFDLTADSGNSVKSAFCGTCGNPIYKTTSMLPDMLLFHAATLDDPDTYQPDMVVYSNSAQKWDHIDPEIPRKD